MKSDYRGMQDHKDRLVLLEPQDHQDSLGQQVQPGTRVILGLTVSREPRVSKDLQELPVLRDLWVNQDLRDHQVPRVLKELRDPRVPRVLRVPWVLQVTMVYQDRPDRMGHLVTRDPRVLLAP